VEFIRFALLLTMTVALISVATRYDDDSGGRNQAARSHQPASTAPSSTSGQTEAPSQGGSTASPSSGTHRGNAHGDDGAAGSGAGGTASDAAGSGQGAAAPTLPRTGGTQALELAALAALFIAAGSFGMRISRPRTSPVHAEGPATAATHVGQARGSSESNRPGTV
jgi:hypothetical protein